jgi:hypothetical protein
MAADNNNWQGGTSAVAQVETFTLNDDWNDGETLLTMTMTAEDGSTTQTVSVTPDGVDETVIALAWQVALAASTETLFAKVTWTVAANVVTGTADTSGVPFYAASSVTGGAGTVTDSVTTASAGPNDWNTTGNWSLGTVPDGGGESENLRILPHPTTGVSHDILYGLDQSAQTAMVSFRVSPTYTGSIGDTENSYYLQLDATVTVLDGRGHACWLKGTNPTVYITGTSRSADAVHLDGAITALEIGGPNVRGTITVPASCTQGAVRVCDAPGVRLLVADANDAATLDMNGGYVEWGRPSTVVIAGGTVIVDTEYASTNTLTVWGGTAEYNGSATLNSLLVYGGLAEFTNNEAATLTVTAAHVRGGQLRSVGGMKNITWSSIIKYATGLVDTDTGTTIAVS